MAMLDRITVEPGKMNGQPCIRGMRITVKRVVLAVATYGTGEALKRAYPDLDDEDVRQALEYAAQRLERPTLEASRTVAGGPSEASDHR